MQYSAAKEYQLLPARSWASTDASPISALAAWIGERAEREIPAEEASAIAAFGLGSLLSSRLLRDVLGIPAPVDDAALVDTWVQMMATALADGTARSYPG